MELNDDVSSVVVDDDDGEKSSLSLFILYK